jgi:hypothetical protein
MDCFHVDHIRDVKPKASGCEDARRSFTEITTSPTSCIGVRGCNAERIDGAGCEVFAQQVDRSVAISLSAVVRIGRGGSRVSSGHVTCF